MRSATARSSRSWLAVVWSRGRLERHLAPALHESRPHYATLVPVGRRARRFSARCGRDVCQPARSWHQLAHMLDGCRHDEDAMCANRRNLGTNWRTCSTVAGTRKTRCVPTGAIWAPTGAHWTVAGTMKTRCVPTGAILAPTGAHAR